jgi:phosphatidylglycerophosphate synthase
MSHNTWAHRLVTVAVRPLAHTSVTPNQITTVRLITGLAAALALAIGGATAAQVGGVLWILSMLCDRADGILARLTGRTSAWGHVYDLICDFSATTLLFVAIGIGMRGGPFGGIGIWLGLLAGGSIALIFWLLYRLDAMLPPDRAAVPSAASFDPDDVL